MYSQNDEEKVILEYFGDKKDGKFLDLGAYDGKTFSNTLALVERGWGGVCVEASPQCFVSLQNVHRNHPQVKCVCAAVAESSGLKKFYDSGGAVASMNEEHYKKWKDHQDDFMEILVPSITIIELVNSFNFLHIDFISVDVEGITMDIFHACMSCRQPALMCVEYDSEADKNEISGALSPIGYSLLHTTGENVLWGRKK